MTGGCKRGELAPRGSPLPCDASSGAAHTTELRFKRSIDRMLTIIYNIYQMEQSTYSLAFLLNQTTFPMRTM